MTKAPSNSQSTDNAERSRRTKLWLDAGFYKRHTDALRGNLAWPRDDLYMLGLEVLGDGGLVCILGKRGTGKTQMAASMALALALHKGLRPSYQRLSDYFAAVKRSFDTSERDPRRMAAMVPVLVLDECQERYESQFEDLELTRLIDTRYGEKRATVLIANLKPEELAASMGASVSSRIQECGAVIECNWPSYREARMSSGKGAA